MAQVLTIIHIGGTAPNEAGRAFRMTYRYRSVRCKHGMCTETVGCEECGVKAKPGAGQHLLRVDRRMANPQPPQSYIHDGGHAMVGNSNARARG